VSRDAHAYKSPGLLLDGGGRVRVTRVLEEDPELGEGVAPGQLPRAVECARAVVLRLPVGEWRQPAWAPSVTGGFGLLLLDGLLLRRIKLGDRVGLELLAGGDLLRPWQREDASSSLPRELGWQVLEPCRLAVLDLDFAERVGPFPAIATQITARAMRRSRTLAACMAIVQQPRVETRIHLLLWQLADRVGTVGPEGVTVPLRLTQNVLAAFVAARRPTVSAAIRSLEHAGKIARTPGGWLLRGSPPGNSSPAPAAAVRQPVG
jgi:CRP/FNR family transcriptional regulator, cyclic AMP receptor protein